MNEKLTAFYDRHGEKMRFLLVGGWNTLFSIGALWVLDRAIDYDQTSIVQKALVLALSWIISVTQNFFTFKLLVFRTKGNWLREYVRMYAMYAVTFLVQSAITLTISEIFGLTVFWANLPTIIVVTIMSYVGHKYFTFRVPLAATDVPPQDLVER